MKKLNDDVLEVGGSIAILEDFDNIPYQIKIKGERWNGRSWTPTLIRATKPSMCAHFVDTKAYSYNITKLWKKCPPKKGVSQL